MGECVKVCLHDDCDCGSCDACAGIEPYDKGEKLIIDHTPAIMGTLGLVVAGPIGAIVGICLGIEGQSRVKETDRYKCSK